MRIKTMQAVCKPTLQIYMPGPKHFCREQDGLGWMQPQAYSPVTVTSLLSAHRLLPRLHLLVARSNLRTWISATPCPFAVSMMRHEHQSPSQKKIGHR